MHLYFYTTLSLKKKRKKSKEVLSKKMFSCKLKKDAIVKNYLFSNRFPEKSIFLNLLTLLLNWLFLSILSITVITFECTRLTQQSYSSFVVRRLITRTVYFVKYGELWLLFVRVPTAKL